MQVKARVLVADPSAESCGIYRYFLENYGYEVDMAHDGVGCCIKLAEKTPDAILLEQGLLWGGADGVLARIREGGQSPAFPVILITDDDGSDKQAELPIDPVVTYLHRPFPMSELVECLNTSCIAH